MNYGLVSEWYDKRNLLLLFDILEDGDLLEYKRQGYSHWAVYVGVRSVEGHDGPEPCVIHRSLPSDRGFNGDKVRLASCVVSAASTGENIGPTILETLQDVLGNHQVRISNRWDRRWAPFSPAEIVARAESLLADPEVYSIVKNNCEHFATSCRYGRKYSRQVISKCVQIGSSSLGVLFTAARIARVLAPLAGPAGPVAGAAFAAVGVAATVIPLAVEGCRASSRTSNQITDINR